MARRLTTAQWLGRLHRAGRTDKEIGEATGRSASYIQKVRTGKKPGESLLPAAKSLATAQQRRTTGTARPLRSVTGVAPRRPQAVRGKQRFISPDRRNRFYVGKQPGPQLINRITEAAQRGQLVRLVITWSDVRYGTGHRSNRVYHHVPLSLWREGENAYEALGDIQDAGNFYTDPESVLANLTYDQDGIIQEVSGIEGWQLHTFDPASSMTDWED